jgi:gas vesicle protein
MTTKTKVILGIIGAAAAGAAIGMLMAPEKGSDLRKKIKKSAQDWANQIADLVASGQEELKNLASKGSDLVNDYSSQAGNAARKAKEGAM